MPQDEAKSPRALVAEAPLQRERYLPRDLVVRVQSWIADDPDPACRRELQMLLETGAEDELVARFGSELRFGTAGLRGPLGAGPARMNRATVRRATAGFSRYLLENVVGAASAGVIVGHDARHGSAAFAREAALVLTGAGIRALRLPSETPTPLLAFAVRHLGCAGGVMITASHNPASDNGYKVYLGDGAQIAPPVDAQIADCIAAAGRLIELPLGSEGERLDDSVGEAYVRATVEALPGGATTESGGGEQPLRVVYTPLHGVGRDLLLTAFAAANLAEPYVVPAQADPDPDFPTVERPNPEEPSTLSIALAEAERHQADLMLANDPDGDRLAVAMPVTEGSGRSWRVLTGDEIGALLGHYLLARCADREHALVVTTIVSSSLLSRMAADAGVAYRETLTGFKWIVRATRHAEPHARLLYGYEEALGFAVNDVVRDKDGIAAALVICRAALDAARSGTTLLAHLDQLARRFGLHATRQFSIELAGDRGQRQIAAMMNSLRKRPPTRLAGRVIDSVDDLLSGVRWSPQAGEQPLELPPSDVIVLRAEDGTRAVVRPSGTEPKLKVYLQVVLDVGHEEIAHVRRRAAADLDAIGDEIKTVLGA